MTPVMINKYLKPALTGGTLFYFTSTSLRCSYASHMKEVEFDDESECVTWLDVNNNLRYFQDYGDIHMVVLTTDDTLTNPNIY
jgi:hypothetical protein